MSFAAQIERLTLGSGGREPAGRLLLRAWFLLLLPMHVLLDPRAVNHDNALYLSAADLLLHGKVPYVDFIDVNPPMIMYLNVVPVAIARLLGVHPIPVFRLAVFGLVVGSSWAIDALLRRARPAPDELDRWCLSVGWVALWVMSPHLGQREHLFVLLYVPLFFLRWLRWDDAAGGVRLTAVLGALAGIGACLKPHFVVIALAPEIVWLATRRRWRPLVAPEAVAFCAVILGYAGHFLFVPAVMREALFHRWIPFFARGYAAFDAPLRTIAREAAPVVALAVVGGLVALRLRASSPLSRLVAPLTALIAASLAMYMIQHKGWPYQRVPLVAATALLLWTAAAEVHAWAGAGAAGAWRGRIFRGLVVAFAAAAALDMSLFLVPLGSSYLAHRGPSPSAGVCGWLRASTRPGDPVLVLSTTLSKVNRCILQEDRAYGSRYLWTFPVPMLYQGANAAAATPFPYRDAPGSPEEEQFLRELGEDIDRNQVKLVLIDAERPCAACPPGFSMLEYLEHVGFLKGAMGRYRKSAFRDPYAVFTPADPEAR